MKASNKDLFNRLESKIEKNQKIALGFFVALFMMEGFGDIFNLKFFFLNMSSALVLISLSIGFLGSMIMQSRGSKLKTSLFVSSYQFLTLCFSFLTYSHYFLVDKNILPF